MTPEKLKKLSPKKLNAMAIAQKGLATKTKDVQKGKLHIKAADALKRLAEEKYIKLREKPKKD